MNVVESLRLRLRRLHAGDAAFILKLVNEPSWLRYIGDKGINTLHDAVRYIETGPVEMYDRLGFGMYLVELKTNSKPIGMCGLIKRESLQHVDIGFAFLPDFCNNGYAFESASAVLAYAKAEFGFEKIAAITSQQNPTCSKLLKKLGFHFEHTVQADANSEPIKLYIVEL